MPFDLVAFDDLGIDWNSSFIQFRTVVIEKDLKAQQFLAEGLDL